MTRRTRVRQHRRRCRCGTTEVVEHDREVSASEHTARFSQKRLPPRRGVAKAREQLPEGEEKAMAGAGLEEAKVEE